MKRVFIALFAAALMASCGPKEAETGIYTLSNANGMQVSITNFGGRIMSIIVPDKDGQPRDVVLGFEKVEDYFPENNLTDFGAAIGRYANQRLPWTA